ncbi:hypothetical protein [Mycolicibacterium sp. CR10]|uniref:DUF7159 family protein n=1 Tax=Mycolicibacterium sp. CR10 TaxID=2562314 RepID=UPI0010C12194|nr:hypothetical protein [Mycolicibacterium sp. CR10]
MNLVLGLSMTSSSVRWVLVEGTTGEGATLDRGSLPVDHDDAFDADTLLSALLAKAGDRRVHAIGLTWTGSAETTASAIWQALTDRRVENVIAVSDVEAAEALTCGIADIAGYDRVVVCVVEPGAAVVAAVTPDGVIADRVDAAALADVDGLNPDAVFVVGSGDLDAVVSALEQRIAAPVVTAADADLALARGAALASASAVSILDAEAAPKRQLSPTSKLAAVLAAAVVTFVVSLSVALGMTLSPGGEAPRMARAEAPVPEAAPAVKAPPPVKAAPKEPKPAAPRPTPPVAEPVAVAVPVPDALPIVDPPAAPPPVYREPIAERPAYIPPAPAYVPPPAPPNYLPPAPAPVYVPPVLPPPAQVPGTVPSQGTYQEPRLRDRIIERIPIINRFHEPDPYP